MSEFQRGLIDGDKDAMSQRGRDRALPRDISGESEAYQAGYVYAFDRAAKQIPRV